MCVRGFFYVSFTPDLYPSLVIAQACSAEYSEGKPWALPYSVQKPYGMTGRATGNYRSGVNLTFIYALVKTQSYKVSSPNAKK